MTVWSDTLQPASWRGLPFAVYDSAVKRGRRTAVHEYPFRDTVWIEDLGRGRRTVAFRGFIVGDDVVAQEAAMLDAAETSGPGELIHPSLGSMQLTLIDFSAGQRRELGRVVELEFAFIDDGQKLFPTSTTSTTDQVTTASANLTAASSADFGTRALVALQQGAASVEQGVHVVTQYSQQANGLIRDVRAVAGAVRGIGALAGIDSEVGRYSGGHLNAGSLPRGVGPLLTGLSSINQVATATSNLISAAVRSVSTVERAGNTLITFAGQL